MMGGRGGFPFGFGGLIGFRGFLFVFCCCF